MFHQICNAEHPLLTLILCGLLPLIASIFIGPRLIAILRALKAGQPVRQASKCCNAPEHQKKAGTPTMGGLMLIGLVIIGTLLFCDLSSPAVQCCLLVTCVTAFLGFLDDYAKITRHSSDGVSGRFKIIIQAIAALAVGCYLYYGAEGYGSLHIPFCGDIELGLFYIPFVMLVIIGSSNAVNLTDGLDGLASGCMIIAALAFCALPAIVGTPELSPFLLLIVSACLGFLLFNCYPAKVFMGDTGSLALGGALGTVAVCMRQEVLLVIIGGVFVAEAVSVMVQVFWFKYTRRRYGEGRRFFRMAPIHHHFEKGGWSETQVCVRFWIAALALAILGCGIASQDLYNTALSRINSAETQLRDAVEQLNALDKAIGNTFRNSLH